MKLFHGTSARHLDKILRHGLKPRGQRKGNWDHTIRSRPDAIYLSVAYPLYYAYMATADLDKGEKGLVLEIDANALNPFRMAPDEDFMEQATRRNPEFNAMQRRHSIVLTVVFDKPCTNKVARREVRDCIHGNFYCGGYYDSDSAPEEFKITSVRALPKEARRVDHA